MKRAVVWGVLIGFTLASDTIVEWKGFPLAATDPGSIDGPQTVIRPTGKVTGAQLPYTIPADKTSLAPLVSVRLRNLDDPNMDIELAQEFDMVNQKCACFYVGFKEVTEAHNVPDGLSYQLVFKERTDNEPREWGSGLFGITRGKSISGMTPPNTAKAQELRVQRDANMASKILDVGTPRVTTTKNDTLTDGIGKGNSTGSATMYDISTIALIASQVYLII
jgi:hypothetical protein